MKKQIITAFVTCVVMILLVGVVAQYDYQNEEKAKVKVGFVYIGDESNPYAYNFIKAQKNVKSAYGDKIQIAVKYNVPEKDVKGPLEELAKEHCDIIFSTSYGYSKATREVAKKYPKIQFCTATGDNANEKPILKNYHTFMGSVYEGRYISGMVAGMKLKELIEDGIIKKDQAKVGYIGAYCYAEVISGYTAFLMGVRSVVPQAVMTVTYSNTWSNYTLEKKLAKNLIQDGCVIISQHSDTTGAAVACEEMSQDYQVYHVGYNQSMTGVAPTTSLISCKVNWEPYEMEAIEAVRKGENIEDCIDGSTYGNDAWAGIEKDWVHMLDLNEVIAAKGTKKAISKTIREFAKHRIKVFYGDYTGFDPNNPSDKIDLRKEYIENKKTSAPGFHYQLDQVIEIKRYAIH